MKKLALFIMLGFYHFGWSQQITQVEYWFNNDFANRTSQFIATNANDETDVSIAFPDNGQNEFFATLYYRFRDNANHWSPIQSKQLFNSTDSAIYPVEVEYWFDNNFAQKAIAPTTANLNPDGSLDLQEADIVWPQDAQIVYYRFKSKYNQWSAIMSSNKDLMLNISDKIVAVEYWYDADFQNRKSKNISTIATKEDILLLQSSEIPTQVGVNYFNYRFLSKAGRWSSIISTHIDSLPTFSIDGRPTLFMSDIRVGVSQQSTLYGYNYTPNDTILLKFFGAGGLYIESIMSDNNGVFSYSYVPPQNALAGGAAVRAFDTKTTLNSPVKNFFIIGFKERNLEVTHPIENQIFYAGQPILITWNDKMVLSHNNFDYPVLPNAARRQFQYHIEYQPSASSNWEPIIGQAQLSGTGRINEQLHFQTQATLAASTNAGRFRVRDGLNNAIVAESPFFEVSATGSMVSLEWDKSVATHYVPPIGVVADGTSRIYVKVATVAGDISHATISLSNGYDNSPNYLGKVMAAKEINTFSTEADLATEVSTESHTVVNNAVWFWYVAPEDFTGANPLDKEAKRRTLFATVTLHKSNGPEEKVTVPILVKRPRVLFAHGLAGDEHTFAGFKRNGVTPFEKLQFESTKVNMMPGASFTNNAKALLGIGGGASHTFQNLLERDRLDGFASCQVDYVAHSMGGNVARACSLLPEFYDIRANYGKGYIHKLITLGTPHNGSPIADIVVKGIDKFNFVLGTSNDPLFLGSLGSLVDFGNLYLNNPNSKFFSIVRPRPSNNPNMQTMLSRWANVMQLDVPILNSYDFMPSQAIANLAVDGGIYFPQTKLFSHVIVGDLFPGVNNSPTIPNFGEALVEQLSFLKEMIGAYGWIFDVIESSTTVKVLKEGLEQINKDYKEPGLRKIVKAITIINYYNKIATGSNIANFILDSDGVVDIYSQAAGLPFVSENNVSIFNYTAHTIAPNNVTKNPMVVERVIDLLNANQRSNAFLFLPANTKHGSGKTDTFFDDLDFSRFQVDIDIEKMYIIAPASDSLEVDSYQTLQVFVQDTTNLSELELIFGLETYGTSVINDNHASFNVQIPNDILGPINIYAKAKYLLDGDTTKVLLAGKTVNIAPYQGESLLELKATRQVVEMWVGDDYRPIIMGVYPSNLSIVNATPQYTGITLEYDTLERSFIAKEIGEAQVEFSYNGLATTVYFIVRDSQIIFCDTNNLILNVTNEGELPCDLYLESFNGDIKEIVWIKNGSVVQENESNTEYTPLEGGEYYAILYATDGCIYMSNKIFIENIDLNPHDDLNGIKIYPNPTSGILMIKLENLVLNEIKIYDTKGQLLLVKTINKSSVELDISQLSVGAYVLRVYTEVGVREFKIIKR
ncbi:MAG: T9SS type A sorting domain-containing protein [Schleiferiaceae bacterium]|nr:T9SS type A sorting domain-containing protein [Schleiferiaceae bacterium]